MNNLNVELGMLCEEIKYLRNEVQQIRELLTEEKGGNKNQSTEVNINESHKDIGNLDSRISNILLSYQISPRIKGYSFVKEAIELVYQDHELLNGITKVLYPVIAHKYNTTSNRVERAIRHAIETGWYKTGYTNLNEHLKTKPTNSEFIALVAEKIRLEKTEYSA